MLTKCSCFSLQRSQPRIRGAPRPTCWFGTPQVKVCLNCLAMVHPPNQLGGVNGGPSRLWSCQGRGQGARQWRRAAVPLVRYRRVSCSWSLQGTRQRLLRGRRASRLILLVSLLRMRAVLGAGPSAFGCTLECIASVPGLSATWSWFLLSRFPC